NIFVKILSVQVGRPQSVIFEGRMAQTGIYKNPVHGLVRVGTLNLEGDEQADLTVHGGVNKAVYAYPSEHYEFWRQQYPTLNLEWGAFGENLTTEGLLETAAGIGDTVQIGTARFVVVQPRLPCYKLAGKFGDKNILQTFTDSGRSGIYFAVIEEGHLQSGDLITWKNRMETRFTIADANRLYNEENLPPQLLDRALELKALPDSWRRRILEAQARNKI
ncbi:MAG TPA: MOSC domain-containing protein, partial [Terriglobia bacterium]|nr:MOSC domain-containing protein [Terriglobia bacterium]